MTTYEEAITTLETAWGTNFVKACIKFSAPPMKIDDFLNHCFLCGGNWGGMFLTGIKELYPKIYSLIPEKLGKNGNDAFVNICYLLTLLNVDWRKEE